MIRRAAARRDGDELEVTDADLDFAIVLSTVDPPAVTGVATALQPEIVVQELFDDGDEVVVLEPDIWETRRRGARGAGRRAVRDPLAVGAPRPGRAARDAPAGRHRGGARGPHRAAADRARPPVVAGADATAADAARGVSKDQLRSHLLALFKASRLGSPAALELVGIYDRVPGGAIGSVAVDAGSLVIRLVPGRRARPTTLVVGRVKASQALVTVEISA